MQRNQNWNKNGPIAAQLLRDLYFGTFNDKTTVKEIHKCPNRPYKNFNLNAFYKHVKNTRNRVEIEKTLGTGIDSEEFKQLVKVHKPPGREDCRPKYHHDTNRDKEDDEDSEYFFDKEEQSESTEEEEFDSFSIESALKELNLNGGQILDIEEPDLEVVQSTEKSVKMTSKSKVGVTKRVTLRDPLNVVYPDKKRVFVMFELTGVLNYDKIGEYHKLLLSPCGKKVQRFEKVPPHRFDVLQIVGGSGLYNPQNPEYDGDVIVIGAVIEKLTKEVRARKTEGSDDDDIWDLVEEIDLAFECEKKSSTKQMHH